MTTVESKIKRIVEKMEGLTYIYENWATANIELDDLPLPVVINVLPVSGVINVSPTQIKDYPNCMIAFADLCPADASREENNTVVDKCKQRAIEFILRVNESGFFEPIDNDIRYSSFYDKLDVGVTGVVLELTLKEVIGVPLCKNNNYKTMFDGKK